jgi:hypothetical protein
MSPPTDFVRIRLMFELGSTFRGLTEIKMAVKELAMLLAQGETTAKVTAAGRSAIAAGISAITEAARYATTAEASGTEERQRSAAKPLTKS